MITVVVLCWLYVEECAVTKHWHFASNFLPGSVSSFQREEVNTGGSFTDAANAEKCLVLCEDACPYSTLWQVWHLEPLVAESIIGVTLN